jgi:putative hydrolase of the HAD superfamily
MKPIKNIIFDLGGVLLTIDYQKTEDAFINLGMKDFSDWYKQDYCSALFEQLEVGKISDIDFYDGLRNLSGLNLSDTQIATAWNAMLGNFSMEKLQWLEGIGKRYRIFLFSNTNIIHYEAFCKKYQALQLGKNFDDYFIKAYYSQQMGLRKPHTAAYKFILEEQGLLADETLMIDDTLKNIDGAKAAGLQTLHLLAPQTLLDLSL